MHCKAEKSCLLERSMHAKLAGHVRFVTSRMKPMLVLADVGAVRNAKYHFRLVGLWSLRRVLVIAWCDALQATTDKR